MSEHDTPGLRAISRLVEGFRANLRDLRAPETSEAVIRQQFVDPFWKALGWDVGNTAHKAPAEADVFIEAPVGTIESERLRSRRPDYLFRIGGFPRFVVEAKRPVVDLSRDEESIFQAKTYAWSAQIPFAILTDFEEFRVFDATLRPYLRDPDRGVIADFDLRFEDYVAQWDVIYATFSHAAVASGSLEQLLARLKKVRTGRRVRGVDRMLFELKGTEPVDRVFLAHLEDYRLRFARSLYESNRHDFPDAGTKFGAARLTEATQRLLDRFVFMRVCEDRGIIRWGSLRDTFQEAAEERIDVYSALVASFREFDRQYNGYLFKAHFSEQLKVTPSILADFIRSLYPPEGPYRFDAIGDDLLGIVYERFLGSTITVAKGNVQADEKPEVRHAGGVYYTPRFVVDTVVRRVVGPKVKGKSPAEVLAVRVLDPACGSGSFLIAAYQYLIEHCTRFIASNPTASRTPVPSKGKGRSQTREIAFQDDDKDWHLLPDFKSRLLSSCIHGVDIDAQAVEVTIMSLYLKVLEGRWPAQWQRELKFGALLPPMDNNVRCGNSLLAPDAFDDWWEEVHGGLFRGDEERRFRLNPFDWQSATHGFGRILTADGGFDCIIGNPPYIRVQELNKWAPDECAFYKWKYLAASKGNYDIYVVFIERALELLARDGLLGFICPHKFWQAAYGNGIRSIIAQKRHLVSIVDFADQQVFRDATTYTAIHVMSQGPNNDTVDYARVNKLIDGELQCRGIDRRGETQGVSQFKAPHPKPAATWSFLNSLESELLLQIKNGRPPLGKVAQRIFVGLQTSADDVFILRKEGRHYYSSALGEAVDVEPDLLHVLLKGSVHIRRWVPDVSNLFVLFPYESVSGRWQLIDAGKVEERCPKTWAYLRRCRSRLASRERGTFEGEQWYGYVYPKNLAYMAVKKILTPSLGRRAEFCIDERGEYYFVGSGGGGGGGYGIVLTESLPLRYMVGLLNSKLLDWYLKSITTRFHSGWFAYNKQYIEQVPIVIPTTSSEKRSADAIVERVTEIIASRTRLRDRRLSDQVRAQLTRTVEAHEARVDELVNRLYGVTEVPVTFEKETPG